MSKAELVSKVELVSKAAVVSKAELASDRSAPFYGWRLLAALWVILFINLAFPMYGLSVLDPYMATGLHLDRTMLGLTYAIYMSMTGIPAPFAAWLVQRFGIRATLLVGNLLLVVGAALMASVVNSPWAIVLVAGALIGTSDAIGGPVPAQASVTRWFVKRRSFALAVLLTGGGIGGFVAAPLLDRLVAHVRIGWRAGWWVIAALGVVACVISWLAVRETPEAVGQWPDGRQPAGERQEGRQTAREQAAGERQEDPAREVVGEVALAARERVRVHITSEDWSPLEALRSPTLWLLMAAALGFSAALTLFLAQGITHLEDLGHSSEMAAFALSFSVLFGLAASLAVGALGDRIDPRWLWACCSGLDAIGIVALLAARGDVLMFASAAALGAAGSGALVCLVTLLANYYGPRAYPAVFAVASAIQSTLGAVAPVVAGYWYDRHGSYEPVFLAVAVLCAAGAVALALIGPPRRRVACGMRHSSLPDRKGEGALH